MIKNRIKEYRARCDMKQEDLAKVFGVSIEEIFTVEESQQSARTKHP